MSFAVGKEVTEKEIKSGRISLPARVRDDIFPWVAEKSKTNARMVDEKGFSYDVVLKVRKKRTKPELMAKGGKKFAQKRNLKPGDVLVFSRGESPNHFRVEVQRWLSLSPPGPPIGSCHAKRLLSLSSTGRIKAEEQLELSAKPPIGFLKDN